MSGPRKPKDIENFVPASEAAGFLRSVADRLEKNDGAPETVVSLKLHIRRWDSRWQSARQLKRAQAKPEGQTIDIMEALKASLAARAEQPQGKP